MNEKSFDVESWWEFDIFMKGDSFAAIKVMNE
jgi:hypothetical protein